MSSAHIDGSGTRALTFTMNDVARTSAQFATKTDDDLQVSVGSDNGVFEFCVPAEFVTIERIEIAGSGIDYLRIGVRHGVNGRYSKTDPGGHGWPHASISARKGIPRQHADAPAVELGNLADILGAVDSAPLPTAADPALEKHEDRSV